MHLDARRLRRAALNCALGLLQAWFGAWSWWLNKPADPSRRRPGGLDLGPFFCEHGLANVNLNVPADKEKFVVVSEAEWDAFLK